MKEIQYKGYADSVKKTEYDIVCSVYDMLKLHRHIKHIVINGELLSRENRYSVQDNMLKFYPVSGRVQDVALTGTECYIKLIDYDAQIDELSNARKALQGILGEMQVGDGKSSAKKSNTPEK